MMVGFPTANVHRIDPVVENFGRKVSDQKKKCTVKFD